VVEVRFAAVFVLAASASAQIYVAPNGNDANRGNEDSPVRTITRARDIVRTRNQGLAADLTVFIAPGTYHFTVPLVLDARDSGTNGHNIVYTSSVAGEYPVISGGIRVTGWTLADRNRNLWSAPAPARLANARQLYIDGVRARRTRGRLPVAVTMTPTGYTAAAPAMANWRNPSDIEFVYTGGNSIWSEHEQGLGGWTEPRCPVASIRGAAITMAQPCWDNSTKRVMLPSGERTANLVGPASIGKQPAYIENAYELLGTPGQFYFDRAARRFYYVPRADEDLRTADVEAPLVETLIAGAGTPAAPVRNLAFVGLRFEYAGWLRPSTPEGFSEIQANYTLTSVGGWSKQGLCSLVPGGWCPYGAWTKEPGNVTFQYGQGIQFRNDAFLHLGAAGLDLGEGAQANVVEGCVFTDISGNGIELGGVANPQAPAAQRTRDNIIRDNYIHNIGAEYRGGIGIVVGYAQTTQVSHNQIDHIPYAAISMGWGGWPDKIRKPGEANYSRNNMVSSNRIFDYMLVLADGGGIYTQGLTGTSLDDGEQVRGNVVYDQYGSGHALYTDNGSCFITVADNVIFHTNFDNWGSRHRDFYNGADGSTNDPLVIQGNYWEQGTPDENRGGVAVRSNRLISLLGQAPASILESAGLDSDFRWIVTQRLGRPTAPEAPERVAAVAGNNAAYVTWSPPTYEGEAPVESYTVTASNGATATLSAEALWSTGYVKVEGLPNGKEYIFTVTAKNAHGTSAHSLPSRAVVPTADLRQPGAPQNVRVYAESNGIASVHFQAPKEGGPVLSYVVTVKPGDRRVVFSGRAEVALAGTTHTTFSTIDGLTPGETYQFVMVALGPGGEGPPTASNAVTVPKTEPRP
jgi:Fibronectin type III domain/Right handed beta helix region/Protein of unknown function (DUF1565)